MIDIFKNLITSTYSNEELTNELVKFYTEWKNIYLRTIKPINDCCLPKMCLYPYFTEPNKNKEITSSEVMGYGMVIFPIMYKFDICAKEYFTNIYNFVRAYPSCCNYNLMASKQKMKNLSNNLHENYEIITEDIVNSKYYSSTGGDMDISYGLLIADKLWRKTDKFDYKSEAIKRIQALMDCCVNKDDYSLTTGDNSKDLTRSSDFILYILREFAKTDTKNSVKWTLVISRIQEIINYQIKKNSKNNGLMPDFLEKNNGVFIPSLMPQTPEVQETSDKDHNGNYFIYSCSMPWRYAMDSILNKKIPISKQLSTLNKWIINTTHCNPENIKSGYYLASGPPGKAFSESNDLEFVAPFLVLSLLQKDNPNWTINLWEHILQVPIKESNFLGNTLKLMAMIVATENWVSP